MKPNETSGKTKNTTTNCKNTNIRLDPPPIIDINEDIIMKKIEPTRTTVR